MGIKIYDIECLKNFFCYCDVDRDTGVKNTFVIHDLRNDIKELIKYLKSDIKHVGFNNISYDAQIIHYILDNEYYLTNGISVDANKITELLSNLSNELINNQEYIRKYNIYNFKIPQLDLYKLWHFDNRAKATRLKDLQVAMRWYNVQDMPIHHNQDIISQEEIDMILSYCDNDVMSTLEFYKLSKSKIALRNELGKIYGLDFLNSNDGKIGEQIFAKLICERKGIDRKELRELRTYRKIINLKYCILQSKINFHSKEFKSLLRKFNSQSITQTKNSIDYIIYYGGIDYFFGLGGIHGCIDPGIYESNNTHIIKTFDVNSLYPDIAIKNRFYPKHLGDEFVDIYEEVFNDRIRAKKKFKADKSDIGSKAVNEGLKYALNITYGKSNEENSFFYDPRFTMCITLNGQLFLAMLFERLTDAGFQVLMANTKTLVF